MVRATTRKFARRGGSVRTLHMMTAMMNPPLDYGRVRAIFVSPSSTLRHRGRLASRTARASAPAYLLSATGLPRDRLPFVTRRCSARAVRRVISQAIGHRPVSN
jgi:hypothetical protein